jgi:hypothetical protein
MNTNTHMLKDLGAFIILLLITVMPADCFSLSYGQTAGDIARINPQCKIKRFSNGDVLVTMSNQNGKAESHRFSDFYADVIMATFRKQRMEYIIQTLGKKYGLSEDDCRRDIKHALNTLSEWGIVIREGQMALN